MIKFLKLVILTLLMCSAMYAEVINQRPDVRPFDVNECPHWRITDVYGWRTHPISKKHEFHTGIDYSLWLDSKARAAGEGEVIFARFEGSYGNLVIVKHEWEGYEYNVRTGSFNKYKTKITAFSYYAHLVEFNVKKGDRVKKSDVVGLVGSTGYSNGVHLHYEMRDSLRKVMPNWVYNSQRLSEEKIANAGNKIS
jgi:murein DD-endopeptidase MepM/ murein hydrolase activator NlpD